MTEITLDWLNECDTPFSQLCEYIDSYEKFEEVFNLVSESEHEGKLNVLLADEFPEFYQQYAVDYELTEESD